MMSQEKLLMDLKHTGHRLTPQRAMILSVIAESQGHITAETVLKQVRTRYAWMNKTAVYRTLDLLAQLNLAHRTDFGHGQIEYEVHQHPHHHHLRCRSCGKMIEVDGSIFDSLEKNLLKDYEFLAELDHFAIFGLCRTCQKRQRALARVAKK